MKIGKKIIAISSLVFCGAFALCACAPSSGETVDCRWELVQFDGEVSIHTPAQASYLAGNYNDILQYAKGKEELSRPLPVHLTWSAETEETIVKYTLEIDDEFDDMDPLRFETTATEFDVYNLCVGTQYIWRVTGLLADGRTSTSAWESFATEYTPLRNLYIDGVTNVRDLGGWDTLDGGRVRQGLIYRTGRLNLSGEYIEEGTQRPVIEITEAGIDAMRRLGIKSEIDLRMIDEHDGETGGITFSPIGEDVAYVNCELEWDNGGNYLTGNLPSVKAFFSYIADRDHYPIIFHCNIGTDRTGMFAFLINGLLGVSEEDLYRDYLFSNFGNILGNARSLSNIQNNYLKTIKQCAGDTLSEQIENCLLDVVGVPQAEIDAIKDILSE